MDNDYSIIDTITADQIENGDQIIIDGDLIEGAIAQESETDNDEIIVTGFSWESGDAVRYELPYDYTVEVWSL